MALSSGTRLGAYEIVAAVGAGGMGEVYRARDTRLQRDVAIKILPDLFAADSDRVTRFQREARMLAALNHPHIAQVFGIEESGKTHALIMEFVDGEDLSERLARGGALPLDEAVPIARQIAEALEAAHEQGIIHRDLKPANVKVRTDGTVKVLDFGLAKPLGPEAAGGQAEAMNSPTITSPFSMSALGVILGTAAYMAPEQTKGKPVDKRSDIWAFGCVLYELLTGQRAFKGEDVSDTLAAVLRDDVDLRALPATTPPSLRRLIARCLERNPRQRLRDIGEARIELARIESGAADATEPHSAAPAPAGKRRFTAWVPWMIAGLATAALLSVLTLWTPWRSAPAPLPIRLSTEIGADTSLDASFGAAAVISPDGRTLVFAGLSGSEKRLYVRRLDQFSATPLAGTEGANSSFFSPNGDSVAFFSTGQLKTIALTGGAVTPVCPVEGNARGGWWSDDDTIVFQPTTRPAPLMRVPAAGGTPVPIGPMASGEISQRWPQVLPGARAVLYTSGAAPTGFDSANLVVQPLSGGSPKTVVQGGFYGRYVSTGHILYMHGGTLFAQPFDLNRLELSGRSVPVLDGVFASTTTGGAQFSVSASGTLVFLAGLGSGALRPMSWMNRAGDVTPLRAMPSEWLNARFSPDGDKLVMSIIDAGQLDVWTYDWRRDRATKLTFDAAADFGPIWTPDGTRIVFSSDRAAKGITNLYWMRADGVGDVQRLTDAPNRQVSYSMHPSGRWLAFQETRPETAGDVMILPIEGDEAKGSKPGTPRAFLATAANELAPTFSPDGRWIAYMSNETNVMQVYVRPFPDANGKWQISTSGPAVYPTWSLKRPELLFVDATSRKIMVPSYSVNGTAFDAGKAQVWSPGAVDTLGTTRMYDLHPDGERIVMVKPMDADLGRRDKISVIFNFLNTIRRGP